MTLMVMSQCDVIGEDDSPVLSRATVTDQALSLIFMGVCESDTPCFNYPSLYVPWYEAM